MSEKVHLPILDKLFVHATGMSRGDLGIAPKLVEFDRSGGPKDIKIFTDKNLVDALLDPTPIKIGWLIEPPDYHPAAYEEIAKPELYQRFDLILTYYEPLLRLDPRFMFLPFGGCWIKEKDWRVYPKTKNISIIASFKKILEGHKLRHAVVERYGSEFEGIFGSGYQPVDYKLGSLKDYRYSIVIENMRGNYFFTEKLIDCFATGTIPVYWGMPGIERFFNPEGIITFNDVKDMKRVMALLTPEEYERRLPAIQDNFERFKRFVTPEDYLYEYILKPRYGELLKKVMK